MDTLCAGTSEARKISALMLWLRPPKIGRPMTDALRDSVRTARSDRTSRPFGKLRRKQTDVRADFQEIPGHPAVPAEQTDIIVLRAFTCRQRNGDHVLGLPAIQPVELALPVIGRAELGAAIRALEIGEENPLIGVAGEELAVLIGTQCLRRRRRGDARLGARRGRTATGAERDAKIVPVGMPGRSDAWPNSEAPGALSDPDCSIWSMGETVR